MAGDRAARLRRAHRLATGLLVLVIAVSGTVAVLAGDDGSTAAEASAATPTAAQATTPDAGAPTPDPPIAAGPVTVLPDPPEVRPDPAPVLAAVDAAAAAAGGTISVVVLDRDGNELVASGDARVPRPTASLVKLLVVQQLLARQAAGQLTLSGNDVALMERAIMSSDDGAMSLLWSRFDGAGLVAAAAAEFGLTGSTPPAEPGQWGEALTTARDTAVFLAALGDHLPAAELATLTGWMRATSTAARDGFDQRFGLLSPAAATAAPVAAKQGWMCCLGQRRQLHSAGILAEGRTVVLLGDFPVRAGWRAARTALDSAAAAVADST